MMKPVTGAGGPSPFQSSHKAVKPELKDLTDRVNRPCIAAIATSGEEFKKANNEESQLKPSQVKVKTEKDS